MKRILAGGYYLLIALNHRVCEIIDAQRRKTTIEWRVKDLSCFLFMFFFFFVFFLVHVWVGGGVCLLLDLGEVQCTVSLYSSLSCFVKSLLLLYEIQKLTFFFFSDISVFRGFRAGLWLSSAPI